eukprot:TRINITY_DN7351_c0_g1_i3.p3 TRINITY_DN7351_c0_g1~~TRINITY_DN7351_c0_g1_i3.p3  ORF type:complete len:137 (-),score=26.12 TRINITY_DN7351_c0_g1_i3:79-489(-)
MLFFMFFFFFKQKTAYEISACLVGSEMCIRDRVSTQSTWVWKDSDVVAVNKFHNAMVGQNEYLRWTNNNTTMLIDRGTKGTVIVNAGGSTYVNSPTNLANGTYTNKGSANCTLNVSNGTISGNIPANSVVVLYQDR